ncbi:MAG: copper transporter [Bacteroidia bacterium]|nr:MAG: copper transporter [Bacteroidia bacterium]
MKQREFKLTTLALKNKTTVYLLIVLLTVVGLSNYIGMPKETFPEVDMPMIMISVPYPGNAPTDIENLIVRPIEKEVSSVDGIKNMQSTSVQDMGFILLEFKSDVKIKTALQDVKDAVDKSKGELPDDLPIDPIVTDVNASEFPIININMSGEFSMNKFKEFAEYLEDKIEDVKEISQVNIIGIEDKLIRLELDKEKMEASYLTFSDIETALIYENMSISGGDLVIEDTRRSVRTDGEFKSIEEMKNIIVKNENLNVIYLKDVLKDGKIIDGYKDPQSISRLNGEPVVTLQVIKKSGENLIAASEQIFDIVHQAQKDILPKDLKISITNDQSDNVRKMIKNLENSIIMGVIFVMLVLYIFLGTRNAMLVGMAIPMSMLISFVILGIMGTSINMMVLFGLILALGMLVDNGIVAIENIHRFRQAGYSIFDATRLGVGEIAQAIIASTLTTLAAFFPLLIWPGVMGSFMKIMPVTLIIVLSSSLFVALVLLPALMLVFKKEEKPEGPTKKRAITIAVIFSVIGLLSLLIHFIAESRTAMLFSSLFFIFAVISFLNYALFFRISVWFRDTFLVKLENLYLKLLKKSFYGKRPYFLLLGTIILLFGTILFMSIRLPRVTLFPVNEPKFIVVKSLLPAGYDLKAGDTVAHSVEREVTRILEEEGWFKDSLVESIITVVGKGAVSQHEISLSSAPNRTTTTINFVDYEYRKGRETKDIFKKLGEKLVDKWPGVTTTVEKNLVGPPTGKPINIEISGDDFDVLLHYADTLKQMINSMGIPGLEGLKIDIETDKPELIISVDREKAKRFGMATGQIAATIRTALFGKEITDLKIGEEKYPVQIQLASEYRNNIDDLMNQIISFRDPATGRRSHVPVHAVASYKDTKSFNSVKRIDGKRVITLYSNVLQGGNANEILAKIRKILKGFEHDQAYKIKITGEQKEQAQSSAFLIKAMFIALFLIIMLLVTQFNSLVKPFIILATVLFSTIGVFGGIATFRMDFVIMMTGIGIISLAGIVVNNGIVLIDYIDYLKNNRRKELGLKKSDNLPFSETIEIVVRSGQTRLRPVLLTAITTILGLLPMAIGFNIDFPGLLIDCKPNIYFGGDNNLFWGPMAWTVIFGLTFATFLTLILVPIMYLIGNRVKLYFYDKKNFYL